jgi:hypothetical protein
MLGDVEREYEADEQPWGRRLRLSDGLDRTWCITPADFAKGQPVFSWVGDRKLSRVTGMGSDGRY